MKDAQTLLQEQLKGTLATAYLLYGEEPYLTEEYTRRIVRRVVGDPENAFDWQSFDGDTVTVEQLTQATAGLPMLAEKKCVTVRDMDLAANSDRLVELLAELSDSCVLVFRQVSRQPDKRKKSWQAVLRQVDSCGLAVAFPRRTPAELSRLLVDGAKRRGCQLDSRDAALLIEQAGNDMHLLLNELEKLAALAMDGVISAELIRQAGTKNLEVRVFQLARTILSGQAAEAFELLRQLAIQREEPVAILGALSTAYADLYRAKVAGMAGAAVNTLAADFPSYKGKEFRLQNAARDARRLELSTLRESLAVLAAADSALKSGRGQERALLEETATRLMQCARPR